MIEGGVECMGADGGVEDGGLLAGCRGLMGSRFGQHRDGVLLWLDRRRLQQLSRRPLRTLALMDHKVLLLLLLLLVNQGVGLNLSVRCNENKSSTQKYEFTELFIQSSDGRINTKSKS